MSALWVITRLSPVIARLSPMVAAAVKGAVVEGDIAEVDTVPARELPTRSRTRTQHRTNVPSSPFAHRRYPCRTSRRRRSEVRLLPLVVVANRTETAAGCGAIRPDVSPPVLTQDIYGRNVYTGRIPFDPTWFINGDDEV